MSDRAKRMLLFTLNKQLANKFNIANEKTKEQEAIVLMTSFHPIHITNHTQKPNVYRVSIIEEKMLHSLL